MAYNVFAATLNQNSKNLPVFLVLVPHIVFILRSYNRLMLNDNLASESNSVAPI